MVAISVECAEEGRNFGTWGIRKAVPRLRRTSPPTTGCVKLRSTFTDASSMPVQVAERRQYGFRVRMWTVQGHRMLTVG